MANDEAMRLFDLGCSTEDQGGTQGPYSDEEIVSAAFESGTGTETMYVFRKGHS